MRLRKAQEGRRSNLERVKQGIWIDGVHRGLIDTVMMDRIGSGGSASVVYLKTNTDAASVFCIYIQATLSRPISLMGGAPNIRAYSRLNCEALSYPT